jgi:hypothetical protein
VIGYLLLLGLLLAVNGAALALVRSFALTSRADGFVAVAVVASAQLVLGMLVAGLAGHFDRVGCAAGWLLAAAVTAAVGLRRVRTARGPTWPWRTWWSAVRRHPVEAVAGLAAAGALAWRAVVAYALPPTGYDAFWYHLTTVFGYVESHGLGANHLTLNSATLPSITELLFAMPLVMSKSDTWVNLVQVVLAGVGAVSVAGITRSLGGSRPAGILAGSIFALTPIVLAQSTSGYVDLAAAVFLLAATQFAIRHLVDRSPATLVLAGMAAGLAIGAKATNLLAIVMLVLVLAAAELARRHWRGLIRMLPSLAVLFVLPALAIGGFRYARNIVSYRNPMAPFAVEAGGHTLFAGPIRPDSVTAGELERIDAPNAAVAVLRSWVDSLMPAVHLGPEPATWVDEETRVGGLGAQWPLLGLPALLVLAGVVLHPDGSPAGSCRPTGDGRRRCCWPRSCRRGSCCPSRGGRAGTSRW